MKVLNNEKGFIKFVFVTAVIAFLVYAGIQFGMPYFRYSSFKSDARELARISLGDVEKTRIQLFERAQELKIPIEEKAIMVTKTQKTVRVNISWSETVDLLGLYQKRLDLTVNIEE